MTQEDIYKRTAEELDMPVNHVKFVIENMYSTLIYYLRNPLMVGEKIQITNSFTVRFMPNRIDKDIKDSKWRLEYSKNKKYIEQKETRIAYLEMVWEQLKQFNYYKYFFKRHEGQTKEQNQP